jgi:hypothetical protein
VKEAVVVLMPAKALAGLEGLDQLVFVRPDGREDVEGPGEVDGAALISERHRLFWRQLVKIVGGVVVDVATGRLVGKPLSY